MFQLVRQRKFMVAIAIILGISLGAASAAGQWRIVGVVAGVTVVVSVLVMVDVLARFSGRLRRMEHHVQRLLTESKTGANEESTENQILGAVETARKDLMSAINQLRADVAPTLEQMMLVADATSPKRVNRQLGNHFKAQTREIEALLQLFAKVDPTEPMPPSEMWAMSPQGLLELYALARRHRPRTIVELGSGTSSVWLAYALASVGRAQDGVEAGEGRLITLDHDATYAERSRSTLELHRADIAHAEVRCAPLQPIDVGGESFEWYSLDTLSSVNEIDMLVVDGPPGGTGPQARYPAVPLLKERLSDGAVIVLDDVARDDEKEIIRRWLDETPGLTRLPSAVNRLAILHYSSAK